MEVSISSIVRQTNRYYVIKYFNLDDFFVQLVLGFVGVDVVAVFGDPELVVKVCQTRG